MTIRGEPAFGRGLSRAATLYSVGPRTRTMMQSCASAAKLRSGGPILPFGMKAKGPLGNPPPRTVIGVPSQASDKTETVGCLQRPPFIVPHEKPRRPGQCPPARAATGRSAACAPRPQSWAFEYRERSRCGIETTSSRRCSSPVHPRAEGNAERKGWPARAIPGSDEA